MRSEQKPNDLPCVVLATYFSNIDVYSNPEMDDIPMTKSGSLSNLQLLRYIN